MDFRRSSTFVAVLALLAALAVPSFAQDRKKLTKDEQTQYQAVTALVNMVSAGKQPAPADAKLSFHNHFMKTGDNVYIPYTVEIEAGKLTSFPVAMYVRAVDKNAAAPAAPAKGSTSTAYAFEDVVFIPAATDAISRAMELASGEYDIQIALLEKAPKDKKIPTKGALVTQPLTVPGMASGLTTSSVILARSIEAATGQLNGQQQLEQPYTISGYKIAPRIGTSIPKAEELVFVFFVYNEGVAASGKPDLTVDYNFFRAAEEKPFSKLASTAYNATTLPGEFDVAAGHQIFVGQGIPLTTFAPGEYKLEIKVTDKTNTSVITRNVPFTVTP